MTPIDQLTQDLANAQAEIKELHEYDLAQKSKLITATHNLTEAQAEIARLREALTYYKDSERGEDTCGGGYYSLVDNGHTAREALSQSSPSLALQGWISVADVGVPLNGQMVFGYGYWEGEINGKSDTPSIEYGEWNDGSIVINGDAYSCELVDITYWLPFNLPPLPTNTKG